MTAAQDLFFLAHYAYNTLNPLVDEVKVIEPSVQLSIEVTFGHEEAVHSRSPKVGACIHWSRESMLLWTPGLRTKADIDQLAADLRTKIDKLKLDARQSAKRELYAAAYSN